MALTKKDLEQITHIFEAWGKRLEKRLEERLEERITNRVTSKFIKILDERFAIQTEQILEYVNAFNKSHEEWLRNHDLRIVRLEENAFGQIK